MQHFLGMLVTALDLERSTAERGLAVVFDAMRSSAAPKDYHALCTAIPEVRGLLSANHRRTLLGTLKGPAAETPEGLLAEIRGLGMGEAQSYLLLGFAVRFVRAAVGDQILARVLLRTPALDVYEFEDREVMRAPERPVEDSVTRPAIACFSGHLPAMALP